MPRYRNLVVEDIVDLDLEKSDVPSFTAEAGGDVLPTSYALCLHDSVRHVDRLRDDGSWLHGAIAA